MERTQVKLRAGQSYHKSEVEKSIYAVTKKVIHAVMRTK